MIARFEPRRSPPGGNDLSPEGSFDLKGRDHSEVRSDRICPGKIDDWIFLWAYFSVLSAFLVIRQEGF